MRLASGMQQPEANIPWEDRPYLDRIWTTNAIPWLVRDRLLELHRVGVLEHGELSVDALKGLNGGGLDAAAGLQLLGSFYQRVKVDQEQQTGWRAPDWKSGLLLELLQQQVGLGIRGARKGQGVGVLEGVRMQQ